MNKMKWIGWPIFILFVIFLTSSFIFELPLEKTTSHTKKPKLATALTVGNEILQDFPNVTIHFEREKAVDREIYLEQPIFQKEATNDQITSWIKEKQSKHYHEISLESKKISNNFYQFLLTAKRGSDEDVLPFIVDMEKEDIKPLEDFFTLSDSFMDYLLSFLEKNLNIDQQTLKQRIIPLEKRMWIIKDNTFLLYLKDGKNEENFEIPDFVEIPLEDLLPYATKDFIKKNELLSQTLKKEEKKQLEKKRKKEKKKILKKEEGKQKKIAFTFDDGPHPKVTLNILKTLRNYDAKATFFMLGSEAKKYPEIVKQIAAEGHELANHSQNHPDFTKMDSKSIEEQILETQKIIEQISGLETSLIRPPYGSVNDQVLSVANNSGISIILWSVDSLDWKSRNANAVYHTVMNNVKEGSIILMHDLYPSTAEALPRLLNVLKDQGYAFVTVSELLEEINAEGIGPHRGI